MKKFLMLFLVLIIVLLVGACGENSATNTKLVNTYEETIESYSTEELQTTLGFLTIKEEISSDVANVESIKIREIEEVKKQESTIPNHMSFKTLFTYNIIYENEYGGESLLTASANVENSIYTTRVLGEMDIMFGYDSYENHNVNISIDTISYILNSFSKEDLTKGIYARQLAYEKEFKELYAKESSNE